MGIARAVCASHRAGLRTKYHVVVAGLAVLLAVPQAVAAQTEIDLLVYRSQRSEEHTSELQSLTNLVCRLLLEKKKIKNKKKNNDIK